MSPAVLEQGIALAEAKNQLSALTAYANEVGRSFVITKNRKPWVEVRPLAGPSRAEGSVSIRPLRRTVEIPDLDALFRDYDGAFEPTEDEFASSAGSEAM